MATDELDVASPEAEPRDVVDLPRRPWHRRVLRRIAKTVAVVFVTLTMLSVPYNAYTAGTVAPPPGLTYVTAAGIHTRYETWGTSGSPIVLVHGAFEDSDTWQDLATLLAQDHRVYALDLTGSGYSQRVSPYTPQHMAAQLTGLVSALHIDHPILVAHSSGAAVAAEAVLESPQTYSGLMFLDGDGLPHSQPWCHLGSGASTYLRAAVGAPLRLGYPHHLRLGMRSGLPAPRRRRRRALPEALPGRREPNKDSGTPSTASAARDCRLRGWPS